MNGEAGARRYEAVGAFWAVMPFAQRYSTAVYLAIST